MRYIFPGGRKEAEKRKTELENQSKITMLINCRSPRRLVLISILLVGQLVFVLVAFTSFEQKKESSFHVTSNSIKSILLWNAPDRKETSTFGRGRQPFVQHGCEYNRCEIVISPWERPLELYDAVIFNLNDFFWLKELPPLRLRRPGQRYVFLTQESPAAIQDYDVAFFMEEYNWTMTYRLDSDIRLLYGRVEPLKSAPQTPEEIKAGIEATHQWKPVSSNKTKLVAGLISHCPTHGRREDYIVSLRRTIKVDLYGDCGQLSCPVSNSSLGCHDFIESNYKFFLSFENALCVDYVTEKFFEALRRSIVPIVYGAVDYASIAPPHSYIDAGQYTPKELANLLLKLDKDDRLYNEYFWWKSHYRVESGLNQMSRHGFCDLCKKLHVDREVKSYDNLVSQWNVQAQCKKVPANSTFEKKLIPLKSLT